MAAVNIPRCWLGEEGRLWEKQNSQDLKTKRKLSGQESLGTKGDRKKARKFGGSRQTAKGFLEHKQASSSRAPEESRPQVCKQRKAGLKSGDWSPPQRSRGQRP